MRPSARSTRSSKPSAASAQPILSVRKLCKNFGDFKAVDSVDFDIPRGCIYALLGPNGAGKSTTLRMILGILQPTGGDVLIDGKSVVSDPTLAKMKMGYMPQYHSLYEDLTVYENLEFYANMYLLEDPSKFRKILDFVELWEFRNRQVGHLSGGMKQRASLACALVHDPQLLILDEPTAGVDPTVRRKMWEYFARMKRDGKTILITTHYMDEVTHAEHIHLIRDGKTLMVGTPDDIVDRMYDQDVLTLTLADNAENCAFAKTLKGAQSSAEHGRLRLEIPVSKTNAERALNDLLAQVSRHGIRVLDISKKRPTLEEAFVHYSGGVKD